MNLLYLYEDQFGNESLIDKLGLDVHKIERSFYAKVKSDMDLIEQIYSR